MAHTYSIGVDIGGTNTDIGLVREDGKIVTRRNIPTNKYFDIDVYLKDITDLVKDMMKENEIDNIDGIGICAPNGNSYKCTFSGATNLNFKGDFNVQEIVNKYMDVPVVVSNDANAAAFGEMIYGGGKGMKHLISYSRHPAHLCVHQRQADRSLAAETSVAFLLVSSIVANCKLRNLHKFQNSSCKKTAKTVSYVVVDGIHP